MTKDISNYRIGKLVVIRPTDIRKHNGNVVWECICDCGNKTYHTTAQILNKTKPVESCGCNRCGDGYASARTLYKSYKSDAKRRNYAFDINFQTFLVYTSQECHYCGASPAKIIKCSGCNEPYVYNGIDRVDNTQGYNLNNIVSCCTTCNTMKRTMTDSQFIEHAGKIVEHSLKKITKQYVDSYILSLVTENG